jgi:hypothetical protein
MMWTGFVRLSLVTLSLSLPAMDDSHSSHFTNMYFNKACFKKSFTMIFQMLVCDENVYT